MKRNNRIIVATILLTLSASSVFSVSQEIAWYGRLKGQRPSTAGRIWLMGADGSNLQYVYETCGLSAPDWSADGNSLLIRQDGYRDVPGFDGILRLDLTNPPTEPPAPCPDFIPPKVVDMRGTIAAEEGSLFAELDGVIYEGILEATWSPNGGEIGLLVYWYSGDQLFSAIVSADPENICDISGCQAVTPIFYTEGLFVWEFDWSSDGESLVIRYGPLGWASGAVEELAVINRGDGSVAMGPWTIDSDTLGVEWLDKIAWAPVNPNPALFIGPVISFYTDVLVGNKGQSRIHLLDLGVENPSPMDLTEGYRSAWSPDGQYLAVEIWQEDPKLFDLVTGTVSELGDFWFVQSPSWKVSSGSPECTMDEECDDLNSCTTDSCAQGTCLNLPNSDPCNDGDPCTNFDLCTSGACIGEPFEGFPVDPGYEGYCCDGEFLLGATECPACRPRGEACFFDDECCSGSCHAIKFTCK